MVIDMSGTDHESSPKLFLSHSHQDRAFALRLGTELGKSGVDAWLDQWEIQPGDSIVQKIFTEGLSECKVFAVVFSKASTRSRWVREELDHATILRIEKNAAGCSDLEGRLRYPRSIADIALA